MPKKKEQKRKTPKIEPDKESKEEYQPIIPLSTLLILTSYLILDGIFLLLLNYSIRSSFNWVDFGIVIVLTLVIVGFLLMIRSVMRVNPLEGMILGFCSIIVAVSALLLKFKGLYTSIFAAIGTLIAIIYISYFYWQSRKSDSN